MNWIRVVLTTLMVSVCAPALASDWPGKPIRFIVPWPPGGLNDLIARAINDKVGPVLGQPVVTEFKAGAGGRIGVTEVARATPDGYLIGMGNLGPLTIFPTLYSFRGIPERHLRIAILAMKRLVALAPRERQQDVLAWATTFRENWIRIAAINGYMEVTQPWSLKEVERMENSREAECMECEKLACTEIRQQAEKECIEIIDKYPAFLFGADAVGVKLNLSQSIKAHFGLDG